MGRGDVHEAEVHAAELHEAELHEAVAFTHHTSIVHHVIFHPTVSSIVASCADNDNVVVWDRGTKAVLSTLSHKLNTEVCLALLLVSCAAACQRNGAATNMMWDARERMSAAWSCVCACARVYGACGSCFVPLSSVFSRLPGCLCVCLCMWL